MRDGLILALFVRKNHREIAASVGKALDLFLAFGGTDAGRWIQVGEEYQPLTAKRLASARKQLSASTTKHEYYLTIAGGSGKEADAPDFKFFYRGLDLDGLVREYNSADENSSIDMWYPTEILERVGVAAFVEHVLAIASEIAFASGYCSLAVHFDDWAAVAAEPLARPLAVRHPGLDLHNIGYTAIELGDWVRGAYWLTLLGTPMLEALGTSASKLQDELGKDIKVHLLPHGVAIQAGERPEPGDVNRGERLPLVRRVAKTIEPILYTTRRWMFGFEGDAFHEWERRHLR